ncbi:MAG: 2Fe-2S iron-sulfur cluster binding domain-containing protein, partial [Chitinophagales bacterium]|nr:2Fe-2S iron-sulfur cluster binding domain-containing protein [Chitinophagales bacterium]
QSAYAFQAGQYVNLRIDMNGNKQTRSYSICSVPSDTSIISVGVKKMENGWMSKFVNDELKEGQSIEVSTPDGKFFYKENGNTSRNHVLVAGGSGITPCLSIIKTIIAKESNSKITLIYSVKGKADKIFGEELESIAASNPNFKIKYLFTFEGDKMIDTDYAKELIQAIDNFKSAEYYACGPGAIISSIEHALESFQISKDQFHREYFTVKAAEDMQSATVGSAAATPLAKGEKTKVVLKFEGRSFELECAPNQKIIDVAIDSGIDAPYSCLVAACCTCRAKLLSGNVEMIDKDSLTDAEIKEGYVLTCQAQPRSHGIVLDYDA